jgi:TRAP-type mannitol/chloroaromatic compound transport system substrate-binding protein
MDRMIIEAAAAQENEYMYSEFNAKNGAALNRLLTQQGVQLRKFSDDTYDAFGEAAEEVFEDVQDHSALAKKIHQSFAQARKEIGGWNKISDVAYVEQRNRVLGF